MSQNESGLSAVAAAALGSDAVSKKDHESAVAKASADAKVSGEASGAAAAKTRIKAIMGSEQAKGREALASHFAYDTDLPTEAAVAALDKAPKAAAPVEPDKKPAPLIAGAPNPQVDAAVAAKPADDFSAGKALVKAIKGE